MKPFHLHLIAAIAAAGFMAPCALAFPPAPYHTVYGSVRDLKGNPLGLGVGMVILTGETREIERGPSDPTIGVGINYTLRIPMDAGTLEQLYQPTAMRPTMPFSIRVEIDGTVFVPMEIVGRAFSLGQAGGRTRLDLTLGVDSDRDGLPDAWEQDVIDNDPNDGFRTLADIKPGDDSDSDGLTNLEEYRAGTYALDRLDGVNIDAIALTDGVARLRFLAVIGRSYRIRSSSDTKTWRDQSFRIDPNPATASVGVYLAEEVRYVDVYVPWPENGGAFFQLFAE